uniref:Large ribosomal subunit protein mL62 n=1 Tax=Amblyomma parvum TaxID=251391 RepID=A0A023FXB0_AMBPA
MHASRMGTMTARRLALGTVLGHRSLVDNLWAHSHRLSTGRHTADPPAHDKKEREDQDAAFQGHIPEGELEISYSRSSGPGGQNVNKVNSKVEIRFHLETASWIPSAGRERLKTQWGHLVNRRGQLVLSCEEQRSQYANTRICLERLRALVSEACSPPPAGPDAATQQFHEQRRARASARRVDEKRARTQWRRLMQPPRIL